MKDSFYTVIPASVLHVKPLCLRLRPAACLSLQMMNIDPRQSLWRAYVTSRYCRTVLIDGSPEAMWGVQNMALSSHGIAWLALTETGAKFPLAIVRRARQELREMAEQVGTLYASISRKDDRSALFARTIGFRPCDQEKPDPMVSLLCYEAA